MPQESSRAIGRLRVADNDSANRIKLNRCLSVARAGLPAAKAVNHHTARFLTPDSVCIIIRHLGIPTNVDLIYGQPLCPMAEDPRQVVPEDRKLVIEGRPQVDVSAIGRTERTFTDVQADLV